MEAQKEIFLGKNKIDTLNGRVEGGIISMEGVKYYKISRYNHMPPFLMTLAGSGNHWMYISSNGALTAGRRNPENCLFPYSTDDKITDSAAITGSKTVLIKTRLDGEYLWEPFTDRSELAYSVERNLYKSIYGTHLIFEEINLDLNLRFSYSWQFSNRYGFIKTSRLENLDDQEVVVKILDGIQNIMPYGVDELMQQNYSTLVDAYKKNEYDEESGIGIYYLSSIPTDKAEPSEGLKATTVWSRGLSDPEVLVSSHQLDSFLKGRKLNPEKDIRASRGAFFVSSRAKISQHAKTEWLTVAELEQDRAAIVKLKRELHDSPNMLRKVTDDVLKGEKKLIHLVAKADGLQLVSDDLISSRHFSNVLFNIMRGGIFTNHYTISKTDFTKYLNHFKPELSSIVKGKLNKLGTKFQLHDLISVVEESADADLIRLSYEYLPLTFGRRHGDPSRPWNRFDIQNQNEDGTPRMYYEGNWRDIFQNWEALCQSFPGFTEGVIFRFLNASTADGYNPYRINLDGIDWETIDPDDPWSNIGYWGDHQIIYLLKLMELSQKFHPGKLAAWLTREIFVYTHVPYLQKDYLSKLNHPRDTIEYDHDAAALIEKRMNKYGADGKLLWSSNEPLRVCLTEKLLVPMLAKLSNLVVDGGIWLNTQRPEWNDANNALVGKGLSMVTVYYLYRHVNFVSQLISRQLDKAAALSEEVATWLSEIHAVFKAYVPNLSKGFSPSLRRQMLDDLGAASDVYQSTLYTNGLSGIKKDIGRSELSEFLDLASKYLEHCIVSNKREDRLYHTYNLMQISKDGGIVIEHLPEMLEGQVAILAGGDLDSKATVELLAALRESDLYRPDQQSYILYPNKDLPAFLEKNRLSAGEIKSSALIQACLDKEDQRLIKPVVDGTYQFNGDLKNENDVRQRLQSMKDKFDDSLIDREEEILVDLFIRCFGHHHFTGRSGTFFKYEGLGSIYWHMVSKLVLAIQEKYQFACEERADKTITEKLQSFLEETKAGIGLHKSPAEYGAFPTDPYSHTPAHIGVQQPGMTGQVKEDIMTRWTELGVLVRAGEVHFDVHTVKKQEFLASSEKYTYLSVDGKQEELVVPEGGLCFTLCQVPVMYKPGLTNSIHITFHDNTVSRVEGNILPDGISEEIFKRTGIIHNIAVEYKF